MPEPDDTISRVNSGDPMDLEELLRARANLDRFSGSRGGVEVKEARRKVGAMIADLEGSRPATQTSVAGTRPEAPALRPNPSTQIVCPHCQKKGYVRTKPVKLKKGVS